MASATFDVFTGDWVRALCSGARLVLCPRDLLLEPPRLYAYMRRHAIDCAEFVPVVLRELMRHLRDNETRHYVREEVPFYTGRRIDTSELPEVLA